LTGTGDVGKAKKRSRAAAIVVDIEEENKRLEIIS
jgi:hypothetical protein